MEDADAFLESIRSEVEHLGFRPDAASPEALEEALGQLDALLKWLRPATPAMGSTIETLNGSYLLSLQAAGIELDPAELDRHVLSVTCVLLAKLVRSGSLVLP